MEHLTKQQIVLLTLLVSFMTSLSTGIITVSLMDQMPTATKTVNQIIEKTIMSPQQAAVGVVSIDVQDQLASSTAAVASSVVKIKDANGDIVGFGLVISKTGIILTDREIIDQTETYTAVLSDGTAVPLSFSLSNDPASKVALFSPATTYSGGAANVFSPVRAISNYSLGQKVFALQGPSGARLSDGFITGIGTSSIDTSLSLQDSLPGSPLFDIQGNIIAIQASTTFMGIAPLMPTSSVL
jgi:S1-C subfamily serine protease